MALIRVFVQDENGTQIGNAIDFPSSMLPNLADKRYLCLRFVDPYGDTVFNYLQCPSLLDDLNLLRSTKDNQSRITIQQLEALIKRCQENQHLYVKFFGD